MSDAILELLKQQVEFTFENHSNSTRLDILSGKNGSIVDSVQGFYSNTAMSDDARKVGAVEHRKRTPHFRFYAGNADKFTAQSTYVMVNGSQWLVAQVKTDLSPGNFKGVLWLAKV
jgi:hypothetical protein